MGKRKLLMPSQGQKALFSYKTQKTNVPDVTQDTARNVPDAEIETVKDVPDAETEKTDKDAPDADAIPLENNPDSAAHPYVNPKQKYDLKRKREFLPKWQEKYPWVDHQDGIMFCSVCRAYPDTADKTSNLFKGVSGEKRIETLFHHHKSGTHRRCEDHKDRDRRGVVGPLVDVVKKQRTNLNEKDKRQLTAKMNTAFYVAKTKGSFSSYPELCKLQEVNGVDMGQRYRTDMACREFISCIAQAQSESIMCEITEARFIAVMGDGSTDVSVTEQEAVFVRYGLSTRLW